MQTAVLAGPYLGERVSPRQWAGFALQTHVLLFGEVMTGRDVAGMALAALGVALVSAKAR